TGTDTGTGTGTGTGTDTVPVPSGIPFSILLDKADLPVGALPPGCGALKPGARAFRVVVSIDEPTRLRMTALDLDGFTPRVFWIRNDSSEPRCVRRRNQSLEVAAPPGLWDLVVEVPERAAEDGRLLLLIHENPR
ncbi:MAG: hypothetical protein WBG86_05535, partial [Polyangiales bacterium]